MSGADQPRRRVKVTPRGPYLFSGGVPLARGSASGHPFRTVLTNEVYSLCRCGRSSHKPFCDGSHARTGFDGTGCGEGPGTCDSQPDVLPSDGVVVCADGPLAVGGVVLQHEDGTTSPHGQYLLCRCGLSATKPFCDGSHRATGFHDA